MAYFHYAFLGEESLWAAEASECAGDQDKFWEYHDYLFSNQNGENQGAFNKENLKGFAEALKLDTEAFNECLDSGKYSEEIQQMTMVAKQIGISSTPIFVINGGAVQGAQGFEVFQQVIEQLLAEE